MNITKERLKEVLNTARKEVSKVIIGQNAAVDKALIVIITGNHALIEGVPGIAKTLLVKTFAHVLGCDFSRIQFTPDLMPSDITGTNVFNIQKNEFTLVKGPVFTTFLLGDEINRAPAKTQSALLQAMQERTVTIDRETHTLSPGFTVFATQNPVEYEGTYPLPEAQKDRFMFKINMDYPSKDEETALAHRMLGDVSPESVLSSGDVKKVIDIDELSELRNCLHEILISDELLDYIVTIMQETRQHESVLVGASPRATQSMVAASRALAAMEGRNYVTPDDIKFLAGPVLEHRLILRPDYEIEGLTIQENIQNILQRVGVPR
jgi:MoxR-like ATPase